MVSKVDIKLNKNPKVGYFCTKTLSIVGINAKKVALQKKILIVSVILK